MYIWTTGSDGDSGGSNVGPGARVVQPLGQVVPPRRPVGVEGEPVRDPVPVGGDLRDGGHERAARDQQPRRAVVEDVGPLGRRQAGIERHDHRAGLRRAEVPGVVLEAVGRQHGEPVPPTDPGSGQEPGDPVRLTVELGVDPGPSTVPQGHPTGPEPSMELERVVQTHPGRSCGPARRGRDVPRPDGEGAC